MKKTPNKRLRYKDISIQTNIFISFIIILLSTVIAIGSITYSSWMNSINHTITKTVNGLNEQIISKIDTFVRDTKHLNIANKGLIEKGIIDINNEASRESFFVNALSSFDGEGIYSFSYGTESGEYYGVRKNEYDTLEIMKNNKQTNGHSWYYAVTDDLLAGEIVLDAGEFDPRTRAWYKAAKQTNKTVFSPIYKHFVLDDLTVSSSIPIYNKMGKLQGVLGSHITLSRINNYLEDIVGSDHAYAVIIEKESGELIANSLNITNFKTTPEGDFRRLLVNEINHKAIEQSYHDYKNNEIDYHKINYKNQKLHIKVVEYQDENLEWVIITAIPDTLIVLPIKQSIKIALILTIAAVFISSIIFLSFTKKYVNPINHLIETQEAFAKGNLLTRANIIRNDEIGMVTDSFNTMADTIYELINNLEEKVEERTNRLRLILDSTAEAIYGIDLNGKCTFINSSGLNMLGYKDQVELIGKNMHYQIHHSNEDGVPIPVEECSIFKALTRKKGSHVNDEVFWKKDGTFFSVEYYSYPQLVDGKIIGAVVTFMDNTEKKERLEKIKYLSIHDQLTGLYNRWYMQDAMIRLDTERNLPFTLMVIDVNGLKLVNDAFGHEIGDQLLKVVAKVLKNSLRADDIVGRVGGDEFLILLPKTDEKQADYIKKRILQSITLEKFNFLIISVAIGYTVKKSKDEAIKNIMISADNQMYKDKLEHGKTMRSQTIEKILHNINVQYDQEHIHAERVSGYCKSIATAMGFNEREVAEIKTTGALHDIGKIIVPPEILNKAEKLTDEELKLIKKHPETGYHILKSVDEYAALAEVVLCHHENWDGTGYPQGLKSEEIPLNSRIIAVADAYEAMTAGRAYQKVKTKDEAIAELRRCGGIQFDPEIVAIFIEQIM